MTVTTAAAYTIQDETPAMRPLPNPSTSDPTTPPAERERVADTSSAATIPPPRNAIQVAGPATAPVAAKSAKIPAPIIEPDPREGAPRKLMAAWCALDPALSSSAAGERVPLVVRESVRALSQCLAPAR